MPGLSKFPVFSHSFKYVYDLFKGLTDMSVKLFSSWFQVFCLYCEFLNSGRFGSGFTLKLIISEKIDPNWFSEDFPKQIRKFQYFNYQLCKIENKNTKISHRLKRTHWCAFANFPNSFRRHHLEQSLTAVSIMSLQRRI